MTLFSAKTGWLVAVMATMLLAISPVWADQYPGVYTNDDSLVFIQASDEFGGLEGIVILSYEYSTDWVITVGRLGAMTDTGILITDGHQYVYNADGTRNSEMEFSSLDRATDWTTMTFQVLPSYGNFLAPMVRGGLAYALVETYDGLPSQLILASEAVNNGESLNLFEGFVYQVSGGQITSQIAFTELAVGSQGLVMGDFPENFPPPPEDYPSPYPAYAPPLYPPPYSANPTEPAVQPGSQPWDPTMPMGTEVPPEELSDQPHFTLEPMHNYDIPPLRKIGVLEVRSYAELEGYGPTTNEILEDLLTGIEGVEVVQIPYDSTLFGGAVMYDRAVWLCETYGIDSLLLTELYTFEVPGGVTASISLGNARVIGEIRSKLVDGAGGTRIWEGTFEVNQIHDGYEITNGMDTVLHNDLYRLVTLMINDITSKAVLEGMHID